MSTAMALGLPDEVVARFRTLALERTERLETAWDALLQSPGDATLAADLRREIHTLKGDARVIGFTDVHLLCHKIEDLLTYAHHRRYSVPEEFSIVVSMGFGLLAMLLRVKGGVGGIDLPGFIVTLDHVLTEERARSHDSAAGAPSDVAPTSGVETVDRESHRARANLAASATDVYLASLAAASAGNAALASRLHRTWKDLRRHVAALAETSLGAYLERHAFAARDLARTLGKEVDIVFDLGDLRVPPEVAKAVDVALLHGLTNAVDHGVEPPNERIAASKPPLASIVVHASEEADCVEILVEDDGPGVDYKKVRQRANQLGLISSGTKDADLVELLFRPGFSTATRVTDLSGRGVGLEAARAAVRRQAGEMSMSARSGGGASLSIRFPRTGKRLDVHPLVTRGGIQLAVTADWSVAPADPGSDALDPLEALGIPDAPREGAGAEVPATAVLLTRGERTVRLLGSYAGTSVVAERHCPTAGTHACEVVVVDGMETLAHSPGDAHLGVVCS